jgi:hypothetical protein
MHAFLWASFVCWGVTVLMNSFTAPRQEPATWKSQTIGLLLAGIYFGWATVLLFFNH